MYEFTHRGAWFKWSALDPVEKRLAGISMATAAVPSLIMLAHSADLGLQFGKRLRGEKADGSAGPIYDAISNSPLFGPFILFAIACGIVSAVTWWRFSLRQDEMFNRIQTHALCWGGMCGFAASVLWWMLSLPGWVGPIPLGIFLYVEVLLIGFFTVRIFRKWE